MSQTEAGPSRRRRGQYTVQACNNCRRRRCKCDGVHPICGPCSSTGHECSWIPDGDDPRPATKQYVESLRVKIQLLESQIAQFRRDNPPSSNQDLPSSAPPLSDTIHPNSIEQPLHPGAPPQTIQTSTQSSSTTATSSLPNFLRATLTHDHDDRSATPPEPQAALVYEYIFNIDTSIPFEEQSPSIQASLTCEWNRHLPDLGNTQLSRLEHDTILFRCFNYGAGWLSGLVPDLFLRDMVRDLSHEAPHLPSSQTQTQTQTQHYTPMLHCSLLAFAVAFSDSPDLRAHNIRDQFAAHAKQWLNEGINQAPPNLVPSLALLSEYHCGGGQRDLAYMYIGMSIRAAQTRTNSQSPVRDWYHWSTFVQEKLMALDRTIPSVMPAPKVDLSIPIAVELGGRPRVVNSTEALFKDPDYSKFVVECFIQSCKLVVVATRMIDDATRNDSTIIDIHLQLESWFNALPDSLLSRQRSSLAFPHVLSLHICYWWFMLHLHLPFFRAQPSGEPGPGTSLSIKMCERATEKIVHLLVTFEKQHGLRFFPRNLLKAIYTCGCALMTEHALTPKGAVKKRTTAQEGVENCISALREIAETWPYAVALANELEARAASWSLSLGATTSPVAM